MSKPRTLRRSAAFDVADLFVRRIASINTQLEQLRRAVEATATRNLFTTEELPSKTVVAFGEYFTLNLQTSSRFLAEQVREALLDVPVRHYDFELDCKSRNWELTCTRLKEPVKRARRAGSGPGFDLEDVFLSILRSNESKLEPKVKELLARIQQEAFETMPKSGRSFSVDVSGTIAVSVLALERLTRAQRSGWRVDLADVYDNSQTFRFTAPATK